MAVFDVKELTDAQYTSTIVDRDGTVIPAASLTSLVLTLTNVTTGAVLNSRNAVNALNANGCTLSAAGAFVWDIVALDNPIINTTLPYEMHLAMFRWVTADATPRTGTHEVLLRVRNLQLLPVVP